MTREQFQNDLVAIWEAVEGVSDSRHMERYAVALGLVDVLSHVLGSLAVDHPSKVASVLQYLSANDEHLERRRQRIMRCLRERGTVRESKSLLH